MITSERVREEYVVVAGNEGILQPGKSVQAAEMHAHPEVDNASSRKAMFKAAARKGVDVFAITSHNQLPSARTLKIARKVRDKLDLPLDFITASETTAMPIRHNDDEKDHEGRHVLVYDQKEPIRPYTSWKELAITALKQKAKLYPAHLTYGKISYGRNDMEAMVDMGFPPDGIEILNGAEKLIEMSKPRIDRFMASRFPEAVKRWAHSQVPELGSNKLAQEIAEDFGDVIKGKSGGSDAHDKHQIGNVLTLFPANMELFDAMRTGKVLIVQLKEPAPVSVVNLAIEHVKGRRLKKEIEREIAQYGHYGEDEEEFAA